jgi:phosphoglycolate phosphatase
MSGSGPAAGAGTGSGTEPRRRYSALVLDLDGTIIDSAPAMQAIAARFLAPLGREPLTLVETRSFIGEGARVFCRRMLDARGIAADGADFEAHYREFGALYEAAPAHENTLFPDARETLTVLAAEGLRLALCTNKPEAPTRNVLAAFGLSPLLAAVVTGDTLPEKKPHPRPLLQAVEALGVAPSETLYVGDSEIDEATAAAAGIDFAFFERGYARDPASVAGAIRFAAWPELRAALAGG